VEAREGKETRCRAVLRWCCKARTAETALVDLLTHRSACSSPSSGSGSWYSPPFVLALPRVWISDSLLVVIGCLQDMAAATATEAAASSASAAATADAVAILKRAIIKEGMLFKSAAAKGKDQMRGNWKDRWFVLKKNTLSYFKAKGETKEKGAIDLRV
jgi:hypothetical protein